MRLVKIVIVIFGALLALAGAASVAAGAFVLDLSRESDSSGFFTTSTKTVGSSGSALTVPDINGLLAGGWQQWLLSRSRATVRVTGYSKLPVPIFIGLAPTARVSEYVSGVSRDRVTSVDLATGSVEHDHVDGQTLPSPPAEQGFWTTKVAGEGSQTLEWELNEGDWTVVIMNADASAPVAADVRLGARFGVIMPLTIGLIAGGVVLLVVGGVLVVLGLRSRRRSRSSPVRPVPAENRTVSPAVRYHPPPPGNSPPEHP